MPDVVLSKELLYVHDGIVHLLLTLAHYTYFFHLPELAIAAVRLLAAVARDASVCGTSPVSVLACLSGVS